MNKPVILLAGQDDAERQSLFEQLLYRGYDVIESETTFEVLRTLRARRRVDLFILNPSLESPGDGVELARLISHHGNASPVILWAGRETADWTAAARAAEVNAYIGKNGSCDDIVAIVYNFLHPLIQHYTEAVVLH